MKIPFSYRNPHFFKTVLITSFLGHLTFLGAGNFLSGSPKFSVEQAPSSMEVMIVKKDIQDRKEIKQPKIISQEASPSVERIQEKKREIQPEKSAYVPLQKGAVTETKPAYLKNPAPIYPEFARERGWEGTVTLRVLVNKYGAVEHVEVQKTSDHKILDEAALKAVKTWQFMPAKIGRVAFSSTLTIPIKFVLVEGNSL